MLAGQTIDAMWASLKYAKPLAFGMNCATGPEFMTDHIRTLSQLTSEFISCYPNAGLPNPEDGKYYETPTSLATQLERFIHNGWLNLVGGCCGTTEQHIRAIDRKSTRLNSSHGYISYAVFCLKKKNNNKSRAAYASSLIEHMYTHCED